MTGEKSVDSDLNKLKKWVGDNQWESLFLIFYFVAVISSYFLTFSNLRITNAEQAMPLLSLIAQVSATICGFLIVALVFLYERRKKELSLNMDSLFDNIDLIAIFFAIGALGYTALVSVSDIGWFYNGSIDSNFIADTVSDHFGILRMTSVALGGGFGFTLIRIYHTLVENTKKMNQ